MSQTQHAQPLFVIGAPRSGTTFLARLLNSHPRVLMTNETAVFLLLDNIVKNARRGVSAGILYGKEYHELLADFLMEQARDLIEGYYDRIAERAGKAGLSYWGEKHPHLNTCLKFLTFLYPNARYIYIVRDPRDSACSIAEMNGWPFLKSLMTWKNITDAYEVFVRTLGPGRCHQLCYEDMVEDYGREAERVFRWLGLETAPSVRKFLAEYSHVDAHKVKSLIKREQDFRMKSVGRWKRELSPADQAQAEKLVGDYLEKYAYARS